MWCSCTNITILPALSILKNTLIRCLPDNPKSPAKSVLNFFLQILQSFQTYISFSHCFLFFFTSWENWYIFNNCKRNFYIFFYFFYFYFFNFNYFFFLICFCRFYNCFLYFFFIFNNLNNFWCCWWRWWWWWWRNNCSVIGTSSSISSSKFK